MVHNEAVYYSQIDPRWKNHPYPSPSLPNATVGSGGCGPTSAAAIVVSAIAEIIFPDAMADWARSKGYRVNGGTADALFQAVAQNWGIEFARPKSTFEMADYCRDNWCVVVKVGNGQFTTGGHFIAVMGINDKNEFQIFDPYLYNGKFERYGRSGKGRLEGTTYWMEVQKFKDNANARAFFAFKYKTPAPTSEAKYKIGQRVLFSSHYDGPEDTVEMAYHDNPFKEGTIAWVQASSRQPYLVDTGSFQCWINDGDIRSLAEVEEQPKFEPYKVVVKVKSTLTIRENPSKKSSRVGSLANNAIVTVLEESNEWARINEGWVCMVEDGKTYVQKTSTVQTTVGQRRVFKQRVEIKQNANMTGATYTYKANTSVIILENHGDIDKIQTVIGKRVGYVYTSVYK